MRFLIWLWGLDLNQPPSAVVMSQTSYQAALPHDMLLLYQRLAKKSRFFLEKLFGGELYEVIIAVDSVRGAGEFERGEVVTNSGGDFASD